jgi:hypothetical protein
VVEFSGRLIALPHGMPACRVAIRYPFPPLPQRFQKRSRLRSVVQRTILDQRMLLCGLSRQSRPSVLKSNIQNLVVPLRPAKEMEKKNAITAQ